MKLKISKVLYCLSHIQGVQIFQVSRVTKSNIAYSVRSRGNTLVSNYSARWGY